MKPTVKTNKNINVTPTHVYFWNGPYSNWHPKRFEYEGHIFENSEQAFMWKKAMFFGDTKIAEQVLNTPNPRENKALGRKVKNFDAYKWTQASYGIMVEVNMAKWAESSEDLLSTGDLILVEASPKDLIWGVGYAPFDKEVLDEKNWKGQNLLGKALMEVRTKLEERND